MSKVNKSTLKKLFGEIPFSAELYWAIKQRSNPVFSRYSLQHLNEHLPEICEVFSQHKQPEKKGVQIFTLGVMHLWMDIVTLISLALSSRGFAVTMGYYPYMDWFTD